MIQGLLPTYYHGRSVQDPTFDLKYTGQGNDQDGPGFYFTSSFKNAAQYAQNGIVIETTLTPRKFVTNRGRPDQTEIRKLIISAPNYKESLENWDENLTTALRKAIDSIMNYSESKKDAFLSVWIDFYRYTPQIYLKNLIALGYDGHFAIKTPELQHVVIYNPSVIHITKIHPR